MPEPTSEKIDRLLKTIERLHFEEKQLRRMATRSAEIRRRIVLGKIDGYCDALEHEIRTFCKEIRDEARSIDPRLLAKTGTDH